MQKFFESDYTYNPKFTYNSEIKAYVYRTSFPLKTDFLEIAKGIIEKFK